MLCGQKLESYSWEDCQTANWLTSIFTDSTINWLMVPNIDEGYISVVNSQNVSRAGIYFSAAHEVIPVLYLDTKLSIDQNTDGSSNNPYKLIVK